jgi:hypothetical protein
MIEKSRWREPAEELPLVLTLSFHDLRAAGSQPAQCLNQNRKSARQAADRSRGRQYVMITAVSSTKPT